MHIEWRVAHSIPLCLRLSRLSEHLPTENPCSENVLTSYSLSVEALRVWVHPEPLQEVLRIESVAEELPPCLFFSFSVEPLQLRGFNGMNGTALSFSMMRSLVWLPSYPMSAKNFFFT